MGTLGRVVIAIHFSSGVKMATFADSYSPLHSWGCEEHFRCTTVLPKGRKELGKSSFGTSTK